MKKLLLFVLGVAVGGAITFAIVSSVTKASNSSSAAIMFESAQGSLKQGRMVQAAFRAGRAVGVSPDAVRLCGAAEVLAMSGDYDTADELLGNARSLATASDQALLDLTADRIKRLRAGVATPTQ